MLKKDRIKTTKRGRSEIQRKRDFKTVCDLMVEGKSWPEIHEAINSDGRKRKVKLGTIRSDYQGRLRSAALERVEEDESNRLLQDLDLAAQSAWSAWKDSCGEKVHESIQYIVDKAGEEKKSFRTVSKSQTKGDVKYLNTFLKCLDQKAKILGAGKTNQVDVNMIIKQFIVDDSNAPEVSPIRSEAEALEYGKSIRPGSSK